MRYILAVVGLFGMVAGIVICIIGYQHNRYDTFSVELLTIETIVGSGLLVAGAVFFSIGGATYDIVAAIERSRPPQKLEQ